MLFKGETSPSFPLSSLQNLMTSITSSQDSSTHGLEKHPFYTGLKHWELSVGTYERMSLETASKGKRKVGDGPIPEELLHSQGFIVEDA